MERIELKEGYEDFALEDVKKLQTIYLVISVTCFVTLIAFLIWSGSQKIAAFLVIPLIAISWGVLRVCRLVVRNSLDLLEFVRGEEQAMDIASNSLPFGETYTDARNAASEKFYEMNDPSDMLSRNFTVRGRHFLLAAGLGLIPACLWYSVGVLVRIAFKGLN